MKEQYKQVYSQYKPSTYKNYGHMEYGSAGSQFQAQPQYQQQRIMALANAHAQQFKAESIIKLQQDGQKLFPANFDNKQFNGGPSYPNVQRSFKTRALPQQIGGMVNKKMPAVHEAKSSLNDEVYRNGKFKPLENMTNNKSLQFSDRYPLQAKNTINGPPLGRRVQSHNQPKSVHNKVVQYRNNYYPIASDYEEEDKYVKQFSDSIARNVQQSKQFINSNDRMGKFEKLSLSSGRNPSSLSGAVGNTQTTEMPKIMKNEAKDMYKYNEEIFYKQNTYVKPQNQNQKNQKQNSLDIMDMVRQKTQANSVGNKYAKYTTQGPDKRMADRRISTSQTPANIQKTFEEQTSGQDGVLKQSATVKQQKHGLLLIKKENGMVRNTSHTDKPLKSKQPMLVQAYDWKAQGMHESYDFNDKEMPQSEMRRPKMEDRLNTADDGSYENENCSDSSLKQEKIRKSATKDSVDSKSKTCLDKRKPSTSNQQSRRFITTAANPMRNPESSNGSSTNLGLHKQSTMKVDGKSKKKKGHKVNCSAWGCQCQLKVEKKKTIKPEKKPRTSYAGKDYGNKVIHKPTLTFFPNHSKASKIQQYYPRLYRWDKLQQQKVKMGIITKEEYLKTREENFADISDEEEERKELKRIDSHVSSKMNVRNKPKENPVSKSQKDIKGRNFQFEGKK